MASQVGPTSDELASVGKLEHGDMVANFDKHMIPTQTLANIGLHVTLPTCCPDHGDRIYESPQRRQNSWVWHFSNTRRRREAALEAFPVGATTLRWNTKAQSPWLYISEADDHAEIGVPGRRRTRQHRFILRHSK